MKYFLPLIALVILLGGAWLLVLRAPAEAPQPPQPPSALGEGSVRSQPNAQGLTFEYPDPLGGTYYSAAEWPPLVERVVNEYSCLSDLSDRGSDGGDVPVGREGRLIDGRLYCVTIWSEGAAGSTYRTYEYSTDRGDGVFRAMFTIRFPQCLNYDEPQASACAKEQAAFDPDGLAARLIGSARLP